MRRWAAATATLLLTAVLTAHSIAAQQPPSGSESSARRPTELTEPTDRIIDEESSSHHLCCPPSISEPRPCEGCPSRRTGTAIFQATFVNVLYGVGNLARGQVTARITPAIWWTNMKRGWEWDLDDFVVNQIGHPYQGSNYFTAGRANGLSFWESAALTTFGSGTWEYFGETNRASLNDFINTTLGGIALGEMFHRTAWLVRDTRATGRSRLVREITATAIDPLTGMNRFMSGDASRVVDKPPDFVPIRLGALTSSGVAWRRSSTSDAESGVSPFLKVELLYGDLETGRSRTPYDGFSVELDFGAGSPISEARVRGRVFGRPFGNGALQVNLAQRYQFNNNSLYRFGAQSFEGNIATGRVLSSRLSFRIMGWGAVTMLGAVDSLPPGEVPQGEASTSEASPGQGISVGPRFYDYGPGTNFGGWVALRRDGRPLVTVAYDAHHLYVLDGVRANHLLQRARAELRLPLRGQLGMSLISEYFDRRTFYQDPSVEDADFHFPQFRAGLTWNTR